MRIKIISSLPTGVPKSPGIVACGEIRINKGRLRAKVVVFDKPKNLRAFFKDVLKVGDLGRDCRGGVNRLHRHAMKIDRHGKTISEWLEVDKRYFCIIGLCRDYLSMEIITHEAVHAAYAFACRVKRVTWDDQVERLDEESICYPAGRIAAEINRFLWKHNLYKE